MNRRNKDKPSSHIEKSWHERYTRLCIVNRRNMFLFNKFTDQGFGCRVQCLWFGCVGRLDQQAALPPNHRNMSLPLPLNRPRFAALANPGQQSSLSSQKLLHETRYASQSYTKKLATRANPYTIEPVSSGLKSAGAP